MPYKRTYRKRTTKKKPAPTAWYNKKYSAMQVASQAWKTAKYVKSLLNVEYKHHDDSFNVNVSTTGDLNHLSNITLGDTGNTRDGSSIKLTGLNIRYCLTKHASATQDIVRFMIVQCTLDNVPTTVGILKTATIQSLRDLSQTKKWKVLYDRIHTLNTDKPEVFNSINIKSFPDNHIQWDTDGTSPKSGALYCLALNTDAVNEPVIDLQSRLRYIDN